MARDATSAIKGTVSVYLSPGNMRDRSILWGNFLILMVLIGVEIIPGFAQDDSTPDPDKEELPVGWQDEWTPATFPNPQLQPVACNRGRQRSWVCDPNRVLTKEEADDLDNILKYPMGKCYCDSNDCRDGYGGLQGSVAIVQKMYFRERDPSARSKAQAAEKFADELRDEHWKFGLCDDDYVVFLSKEDRQLYTSSGGTTKTVLTDHCVTEVFQKIRPQLAKGNFSTALKLMMGDYALVSQKKHECNKPKPVGPIIGGVLGALVALIIACVCCALCQKHKKSKKYDTAAPKSPIYRPAPTEPPKETPTESPAVVATSDKQDSPNCSHHGSKDSVRGSKHSVASKESGGGGGGF